MYYLPKTTESTGPLFGTLFDLVWIQLPWMDHCQHSDTERERKKGYLMDFLFMSSIGKKPQISADAVPIILVVVVKSKQNIKCDFKIWE